MSFVLDHVRRIDSQVDQLQLSGPHIHLSSSDPNKAYTDEEDAPTSNGAPLNLNRVQQLQSVVAILSTAVSSRSLLSPTNIQAALRQAQLSHERSTVINQEDTNATAVWAEELEWVIISKATIQTYGQVLNLLVDQTLPLSDDISYWDEVLSSYFNITVYSVQTSPSRLWQWGIELYHDVRGNLENTPPARLDHPNVVEWASVQWVRFYRLVKQSVRDRSITDIKSRALSPLTFQRAVVRRKRREVKKLRELSASGLGVLMDEGLNFDVDDEGSVNPRTRLEDVDKDEWKSVVIKSVALIETVLRHATSIELGTTDFEETVFTSVEEEPVLTRQRSAGDSISPTPAVLGDRLQQILQEHMPNHVLISSQLTAKYGKPSFVIRYWVPTSILLLSSSTLLRIFFNRHAQILTWVRDLGTTIVDFWYNWIVEPIKNVIGTIRHDGDSGIAIMSKGSLEGDRASLERMVVDFAIDHPETSNSSGSLSEVQISNIRTKVREGDLTPILKAYEQDLRRPFIGTVRGELIRALLIQVQKTKVDVEVAVAGIDNLIKSQELVFGFVGLTPGILICLGVSRWFGAFFGRRKTRSTGHEQGKLLRLLRNVDRILTACIPSDNGMLSYKEHGLLLCEVHELRQKARSILPSQIHGDFLEEIHDLVDIRAGVQRQLRVVERIRWAYSKWLQ